MHLISILTRIFYLSLGLLICSGLAKAQSVDPWMVSAERIDANNYYGVTVANGMIGLVSSLSL